jgi:hypothetical protein
MLQRIVQADIAFSIIGALAVLTRCVLHMSVQSGRLQLYRPGHRPTTQPGGESGRQAQPLVNLPATRVTLDRPSRPARVRQAGSTMSLPRYAGPREDPPPPYTPIPKEVPEERLTPI